MPAEQQMRGTLVGSLVAAVLLGSCGSLGSPTGVPAPAAPMEFVDPQPRAYRWQARASELDPRTREYPAIDFVFAKGGRVEDLQHAAVDTRVQPRGKLVVWLMRHNRQLFDRLTSYGLHAIQPHYANRWFSKLFREGPVSETCRGDMRLEAATGQDYSDAVALQPPDGMMERVRQMLLWLARQHPAGRWDHFLSADRRQVRWQDVIVAGSSHGSTTAARFAKHQRVSRVVMLCGPRDQLQTWQGLPSATPAERYFGFSHVLDKGWTADHYCRSWELLGLHRFGPLVDVDNAQPPYANSRRLLTAADVGGDARKAHSSVQPGRASPRGAEGRFRFEPVWRYLFTHPTDSVGVPVPMDVGCQKSHR